ncbi:hypothetical protein N802_04600 [Knoellia sinensis KCTC 19936]|uniref:Uncharacterized protein n=1 Tax=Knoellia sinensis KCTC 19936 TaxID=1385520 RepID=A0A0A0J6B6_9MICO|nr:hypothetical protein [Knoellia sinensis]KGN31131.1 hypothetical protein N802_04600 [Knoellia sinensis KCTC 19936]
MRLPVDDEIYNVNSVWLGPPGRTLPFRARYVAYAVGAVVFVLLQAIERRLGIGLGFFVLAYSVLATVGITRGILALVDHDRPVFSALRTLANEVGAPRADTRLRRVTIRPARVRAVPSRPSRVPPHGRTEVAA